VVADAAGQQQRVAGHGTSRSDLDSSAETTDTGGGDVQTVAATAFDDLGVTSDHPDSRLRGGRCHRRRRPTQDGDLGPLLDHEGGGEVERLGADAGEVVDGPVDGERTDVAAGELEWLHDEGIGRDRQSLAADVDDRGVTGLREERVVERGEEHLVEQPGRHPAAAAVPHDGAVAMVDGDRTPPVVDGRRRLSHGSAPFVGA